MVLLRKMLSMFSVSVKRMQRISIKVRREDGIKEKPNKSKQKLMIL